MHYVYTKEGIASARRVSSDSVKKYEKRAEEKGFKPSKIIDGIKYYDYDELFMLNVPPIKQAIRKKREEKNKSEKRTKRMQLSFYDLDGFF